MIIKDIIDEDFTNYKKASMFIIFPTCTFKCEKDSGVHCCQNSAVVKLPNIDVSIDFLLQRYLDNPITHSVVCGGLEPFDSWDDLLELVCKFRNDTDDDIVIYTGYDKTEIEDKVKTLSQYSNIIIKYGRFVPNGKHIKDEVLGIELASDNQYAEKIS